MDYKCSIFYNELSKNIILSSNVEYKFGWIHDKILELFNLIIYNIEYCSIKINDDEFIIGSKDCPFNSKLSELIKDDTNINIEFNILDRKRDENGNVIKKNEIIDNYYKWNQEYENNNYINRINQYDHVMFNQYETNQIQNNSFFNDLLSNITSSIQDQINNLENNQNNTQDNISTLNSSIDINTESNEENIMSSHQDSHLDIQTDTNLNIEELDENEQSNNQGTINIDNIVYNNLDSTPTNDFLEVNTLTNEYINIIRNTISSTFESFQNQNDNDININDDNFNQNIIIALSEEEFNELEIIKENENVQDEKCNICLSELNKENKIIKLKCGHFFDYECIENWLRKHSNKCPTCRIEIAKGEPINL